jgi:Zn-dependent peptidase ImmA (M78 family)
MNSSEFIDNKDHDAREIEDFIQWVCGKLQINIDMPNITYSREKESAEQHRTGWYNADNNEMWIYIGHRNLVDILRTVAHELSHHKQNLDGHTSGNTDLAELETQADMAAGMLVKIWVRKHPEVIE